MRGVQQDLDAGIAAIGTGDLAYAEDFRSAQRLDFPVLVDPGLLSYRAVEARTGTVRQMVSAPVLRASARALRAGNVQGRTGQHPLLLGATHAIRPDGRVVFAWRNDDYGDNPPVSVLRAALPRGVE